MNTGNSIIYNPEHCRTQFSPCSTFKIPNSLIGLESGVIPDTAFVIGYDSILHPRDSFLLASTPFKYWYQDLSLQMAFRYSCVWYYQELARRVGKETMEKYVNIRVNDFADLRNNFRIELTKKILRELKIIQE